MSEISANNLEVLINDFLKEDLNRLDKYVNSYNDEIMEFIQLKNSIQTMRESLGERFKTQMNIGGSTFMEAEVNCMDKILVDVGKSYFVEFTLDEAIKFSNFKVSILLKECQVCRDESVKKRSQIKQILIYLAENKNSKKF